MFILYTDGGARGNPGPAGCGALIFDDNYKLVNFVGAYLDHATNNFAEYHALLIGLKLAQKAGIKNLICRLDSELVVKQLNGEYKVKDSQIAEFHKKLKKYIEFFDSIKFEYVPREENKHADKLVNLILDIKTS
jgi:ribonuclease HI